MTKTNGKHQQTKVYRQIPNKVKFRIYQLALICTEQYIYIYTEIEYRGINKGWGTRTLPPKQYAQVNITYKIKKQVLQQLLRAFFFSFWYFKWGTSTSRSCFCCEAQKFNPSTDATASTDGGEKKGWECNGVGKTWERPLKNGRISRPPLTWTKK